MPRPQDTSAPFSTASRALVAGLLVLALVLALAAPGLAQPPALWVPDELLVGFHAGVPDADAETVYRGHGAAKLEKLRGLQVHRVRVPAPALEAIERALARRPEVQFVERNHALPLDMIPNDPSYSTQWHLPKISAPLAWDITPGSSGVIIAILDSGIDASHPDLAGVLVPGYNFYSNNADTSDVFGHGTKVAGAAAAIGNNSVGVAGVAWQSRIMPMRVTDSTGYAYYSTIANALTWAADHGAKVMNISIGGVAGSSAITSAAQYVRGKGGVVVASAGNCGCWDGTAENPSIISVSATDSSDNLTSWSNRGNYVDVSAPGASIKTTTKGGGYASVSGTSFSSPITAGVVALMMSANPSLGPTDLEALLKANADDKGAAGWDSSYGFGRVNAHRAAAAATASVPPPDTAAPQVGIGTPSNGSKVSGSVTVTVSASDDGEVARVDLFIDGVLHGSSTTAPYSFYWDTKNGGNGRRTLVAKAVDAAGNVGSSTAVEVDVDNTVDATAPSVTITSAGASKNKLVVAVSASDNVGVVKVDLYVDGALAATDTGSPWSFSLNLRSLSSGAHTLQVRAWDAAGNSALSAPTTYTK
jgi:thermitase